MKTIIALFVFSLSSITWAYPEMIRHGYASCTVCHFSPSGGGILTSYGRSLANELMTYNGVNKENSTQANPQQEETKEIVSKWLNGGNARVLLFHRKNEYEDSYAMIPMQLEAYGAYNTDKYAFVFGAAVSGQRSSSGGEGGVNFIVSNAYGLYRINDEVNVRAGQFFPAYGLNNALHATATRAPLGFGFKDQRLGVELSYLGENWGLILSQLGERGPHIGDSASSVQLQYAPTNESRLAINYWSENNLRDLYGFWLMVPVSKKIYISADYNIQKETQFDSDGTYYYAKLGYEFKQGLHTYLIKDFSQRDKDLSYTKVDRYGIGTQLFPYLHWEVDAVWLKEKNMIYSRKEADYAYVMVHYYL